MNKKIEIEICVCVKLRYGICFIDCNKEECIINALEVGATHQKKGVGTFLIKKAEEFIRDNLKGNVAILYVEKNTWQSEWYKRLGYYESDVQDGGDGYIRMEKILK